MAATLGDLSLLCGIKLISPMWSETVSSDAVSNTWNTGHA